MSAEQFWWLLTWSAVSWYLTVTVVISVSGVRDIQRMLRKLGEQSSSNISESTHKQQDS